MNPTRTLSANWAHSYFTLKNIYIFSSFFNHRGILVQLNMICRFSESQNSVLMHPGVVFALLFLKSCCWCPNRIHSFLPSDLTNCVLLAAVSVSSPVLSSCTSRPISNPLSTPLFNHSISHCFTFIFCSIPLSAYC